MQREFLKEMKPHWIGALYAGKETARRTKVKKGMVKCIFRWTSVCGGDRQRVLRRKCEGLGLEKKGR
jgi:hypothetical protein